MKKKLVVGQFILMMLFVSDVQGQDSLEKLRKRARQFEPIILAAASRYNVDPHLLWTIAYMESRFKPQAVSYKDGRPCAFGLMQFVSVTAQQYRLSNPLDAREAVDAAARYVRDLLKRFQGHGELVLAAYNAGEGTVEAYRDGKRLVLQNGKVVNPSAIRTGGIPPYAETQSYVARGRLVYQNITRQQFIVPLKSSGSEAWGVPGIDSKDGQIEASIYVSIFGSSARSLATQSKGSEGKEGAHPLSLYVN